jgi:hypothetical protein
VKNEKKQLWVFPWLFRENIILVVGLNVIGFLLELFTNGAGVPVFKFPFNLVFIFLLILICCYIRIFYKTHSFFQWITSIKVAITSIVVISVIVLLMGFIPQNDNSDFLFSRLGFTHLFRSWPYFFSSLLLMLILGSTICKRIGKWNLKNISFLFNHLGLWIVIAAASLGNGDMQRVRMICYYQKPVWYGFDYSNKNQELPFAIVLKKFSIEDYFSEIVLIQNSNGKTVKEKNTVPLLAEKGAEGKILDYRIIVKELIPEAFLMGETFREVHQPGAVPAAEVQIFIKNIKITEGWISASSFMQPPTLLKLKDDLSIALALPSPKKFRSDIKIYTSDEKTYNEQLEVNKPVNVMGWELYQNSYDTEKGRYSEYSVIEAVKDPWLWVVYIGITMLLFGSCLLFWVGKSVKTELK